MRYDFKDESKIVVQIGANVEGITSDLVKEYIFHQGYTGVLVEASPECMPILEETYKDCKGVYIENVGINSYDGMMLFYQAEGGFNIGCPSVLNSAIKELSDKFGVDNKSHEIKIICMTLNSLFKKYNLDQIDLLQISIEGYDGEVLMSTDFNKIHPKRIVFEFGFISVLYRYGLVNNSYKDVINYLEKFGYVVVKQHSGDVELVLKKDLLKDPCFIEERNLLDMDEQKILTRYDIQDVLKDCEGLGLKPRHAIVPIERCLNDYCKKNNIDISDRYVPCYFRDLWDNILDIHSSTKSYGGQVVTEEFKKYLIDDIFEYFGEFSKGNFIIFELDQFENRELFPNLTVVGPSTGEIVTPYSIAEDFLVPTSEEKDTFCVFVGSVFYDKSRVKMMEQLLGIEGYKLFDTVDQGHPARFDLHEYFEMLSKSIFSLCPRGVGPTSFRLYESIAMGAIPIYIWREEKCLPYKDELDWNEFSIILHDEEIDEIPMILNSISDEKIKQMQSRLKEVWRDYFCRDAICRKIIEYIIS